MRRRARSSSAGLRSSRRRIGTRFSATPPRASTESNNPPADWRGCVSRFSAILLAAWPLHCVAAFIPENQRQLPTITIHVAPSGNDAGDGSEARPFQSLARAQRAVRAANGKADVNVELADGIYRLGEPMQFRAADGGQSGTRVVWKAAANAWPVIAGCVRVSAWKLFDAERQIYVADIPRGVDSRQIWVGDRLAKLASIELARASVTF